MGDFKLFSWSRGATFYVRFDASSFSVLDLRTLHEFHDRPIVAIGPASKGAFRIVAVGAEAEAVRDSQAVLVNPFGHERIVIHEFEAAQALLRYGIERASRTSRLFRPTVVMQPLRELSGGLSDIERRALLECAFAVGARSVALHVGAQLSPPSIMRLAREAGLVRSRTSG